ncbi:MAG: hypothetical protein V7679_03680 [Parasphingorhabdus sp.]
MTKKFEKATEIDVETHELLSWHQPTIRTFDVLRATEGGSYSNPIKGDDGWYAS